MDPHDEVQPWPSGDAPVPAWTKEIDGKAYTVKPVDRHTFGIWRNVEELGTFELSPRARAEPSDLEHLSIEARTVARAFAAFCRAGVDADQASDR